jgi:RNA polymerase sigma factor (sigma-70 family)
VNADGEPVSSDTNADDHQLAVLMQEVQAGDGHAYRQLLKKITPRLRHFIQRQRRFPTPADVDDVVQDVLLSLHAVRATYDPQRPFLPWLFAIARNRLVDTARRYGRGSIHEVQVERLPVTFVDEGTNMEREVYQDPDALRRAIEQLPPAQRDAIELLKLREMTLKETAATTGTSVGALKVSVHRAMANLRKTLTKS